MPFEITGRMLLFGLVVLGYLLATNWTERIRRLFNHSYFRPWRGDPWPRGIQEDNDVRWRWARPRTPMGSGGAGGGPTAPTQGVKPSIGRPSHQP